VPQGLSISNLLSSLYLGDIDTAFGEIPDIDYFRFVDDILIICEDQEVDVLKKKLPALI